MGTEFVRTEVELALGSVEDGICLDRGNMGGLLGDKLAPTQMILLRKDPPSSLLVSISFPPQ